MSDAFSEFEWIDDTRKNRAKRSVRMAAARQKGTHTKAEWKLLKSIFGHCVHCGRDDMHLERDHIKPVYQGGCDCIGNIQPSCARCNASKGPDDTDMRGYWGIDWANAFIAGRM